MGALADSSTLEMAVSHALLRGVAAGERPTTMRVYRPQPTLAFGRRDQLNAGFARACAVASTAGFAPVIRLAGGHAAAYGPGCLIIERALPAPDIARGLRERFDAEADFLLRRLQPLGVDLRIGEIPGEYCPGDHSISIAGKRKVAGIAQRVVKGAALLSTVLVIAPQPPFAAVIAAVYDALGIPIDPAVTGALSDAVPRLEVATVESLLIGELDRAGDTGSLLAAAPALERRHVP